jgi:hypothetical protein
MHSPTATATPTSPANCLELLVNGDFEAGSLPPWGNWADAGLGTGRDSAYGGWLGGSDDAQGELFQWVIIPTATYSASLNFWWLRESGEEQWDDTLSVIAQYDDAADHLATVRAVGQPAVWQHAMVDLTAYAGDAILVTFQGNTSPSVPTTFRVDDVTLAACVELPPTATPPTLDLRLYLPLIRK